MQKKIIYLILLATICFIPDLAAPQGAGDQETSESAFQLALPEVDITPFLPPQKAEGNAAEFYIKALAILEQYPGKDRLLKDVTEEPNKLLHNKQVQEMLSNICEGARIKNCDFKIAFPAPASIYYKRPDFNFFQGMCMALRKEANSDLDKSDYAGAIERAKIIVALGNHLRQSAYHPIDEMADVSLEEMGIRNLQKIYQKMNDKPNADRCQQAVDKLQLVADIIMKKMTAKGTGPGAPTVDTLKAMLKDKAPCMRIDALFIIGTALDPNLEKRKEEIREKLKKQFGAEVGEEMFKQEAYTMPYVLQLKTKKQELRAAVASVLNDPDRRVRDVAEKVAERLK
jgi:hypothetical protein